jgi:hypothetical protein
VFCGQADEDHFFEWLGELPSRIVFRESLVRRAISRIETP